MSPTITNIDPLLYEMGRDAVFGMCIMALVLVAISLKKFKNRLE